MRCECPYLPTVSSLNLLHLHTLLLPSRVFLFISLSSFTSEEREEVSLPSTWALHALNTLQNLPPQTLPLPPPPPFHDTCNSDSVLHFYQLSPICAKSHDFINDTIVFYTYGDLFQLTNFQIF